MELIPGKRYEWCIYGDIHPDDVKDRTLLRNGLFSGEYLGKGIASLVTREGVEWAVQVEYLREWRKKR